jgi:hypothetical protein
MSIGWPSCLWTKLCKSDQKPGTVNAAIWVFLAFPTLAVLVAVSLVLYTKFVRLCCVERLSRSMSASLSAEIDNIASPLVWRTGTKATYWCAGSLDRYWRGSVSSRLAGRFAALISWLAQCNSAYASRSHTTGHHPAAIVGHA